MGKEKDKKKKNIFAVQSEVVIKKFIVFTVGVSAVRSVFAFRASGGILSGPEALAVFNFLIVCLISVFDGRSRFILRQENIHRKSCCTIMRNMKDLYDATKKLAGNFRPTSQQIKARFSMYVLLSFLTLCLTSL
jgi:hypothetical protein